MALRAALLLCALAAAPSRALDGEDVTVSAVLLLSRHADRELLVKSGAGFAEATSGLLTEVGYARMQALGHTLRQRYAGDLRLPAAGDADASRLAHTRVEARSSGFDRSIASGDAVLQQLLEGMPRRPIVFSQQDDNDILLRGYSKCAAFHATVAQERKSSQRYINRDDGTREMRLKAARALGQPDAAAAALHGVWNLYDLAERAPKAIQDEFLEPLSELRDWVAEFEYEDSRHDATASYLLRDANSFLRSFQAWEAKTGDKPGHVTYKHYFAHFPTLSSFAHLAGLEWVGVPGYGETFALELFRRKADAPTTPLRIRFVSLKIIGDSAATFAPSTRGLSTGLTDGSAGANPLLSAQRCVYPAGCALHEYLTTTAPFEKDLEGWCKGCDARTVAVCGRFFPDPVPTQPTVPISVDCKCRDSKKSGLIGFIIGGVVGLSSFLAACRIRKGCDNAQQRKNSEAATAQRNEAASNVGDVEMSPGAPAANP